MNGQKIHTIRGNYAYWSKIVSKVSNGEAIISLRQWTGRPYNSPQVEVMRVTKAQIQKVHFDKTGDKPLIRIGEKTMQGTKLSVVARNDGFEEVQDFLDWFPKSFDGCLIHFKDESY